MMEIPEHLQAIALQSQKESRMRCPACKCKTFQGQLCKSCAQDCFNAMVPADVREEMYMATHRHRILPSGDVEYAGEDGGY